MGWFEVQWALEEWPIPLCQIKITLSEIGKLTLLYTLPLLRGIGVRESD